jgi:hypothetical protein
LGVDTNGRVSDAIEKGALFQGIGRSMMRRTFLKRYLSSMDGHFVEEELKPL